MKKTIYSFMALVAFMALTACGGNTTNTGTNSNETENTAEIENTDDQEHMYFMDLKMGGDPAQFIATLRERGFTDGSGYSSDENEVFLRGDVYGEITEICVDTNGGKVKSVSLWNSDSYTRKAAIERYNYLIEIQKGLYGDECKTETSYDSYCVLKLPYGKITCSYGCYDSGDYNVNMSIDDFIEEEDDEQQE